MTAASKIPKTLVVSNQASDLFTSVCVCFDDSPNSCEQETEAARVCSTLV